MIETFIDKLTVQLQETLPGMSAQELMMPVESTRARFDLNKQDVNRGGVLILLYPKNGTIYLPLTQRHDYGGVHGGQVSLPGGKLEDGDDDIVETALRETYEEIGVDQRDINVIGRLTDLYIPPSNFRVTPVIGYLNQEPLFKIDSHEVKELIESPLNELLDESRRKRKDIPIRKGMRINAPYFDVNGKVVWGATAMILSEFHVLASRINLD